MRLLPAQKKIIKDKLQKLKCGAIYYSDDMGTEDEGEVESEEEEVDGDEGAEEEDEDNKKKKTRRPTKGNFVKLAFKQECIPIGCIPPIAVAVSPATHAPPPPCTPPCHTCPLLCMPPTARAPPRTEFLTHACENITFPQLLLLTVIMYCKYFQQNMTDDVSCISVKVIAVSFLVMLYVGK